MEMMYATDDIAKMLNIKPSTFRKYCALLEKEGYIFHKNIAGHRHFSDEDILVFKKLIELKNKHDRTLESACVEVIAWKEGKTLPNDKNGSVGQINGNNELLEEFQSFKKQQEHFNRQLLEQIQKQQDYIANHLNKRDAELIKVLKDSMETQKQLATSEEPKKKWWQFWK